MPYLSLIAYIRIGSLFTEYECTKSDQAKYNYSYRNASAGAIFTALRTGSQMPRQIMNAIKT